MIATGKITDRLAACIRSEVVAAPGSSPGWRVRNACSLEPLELRSRQPSEIVVNLDHDWQRLIGAVRHLEVGGHHDEVWAVCDIRDSEQLPRGDDLYFSVEGRQHRDGSDAILSAIAITERPASVGLPPIRFLDGEVRNLPEEVTLRMRNEEPFLARLLERARAATKGRRYGEPIIVEDRHAQPVGASDYPDEWHGPIEHSAPYAGVISVR